MQIKTLRDVDRDHLGVVRLAKHYNTGSHQSANPANRGKFDVRGAMSELHHMIDLHGFSGISRNPF